MIIPLNVTNSIGLLRKHISKFINTKRTYCVYCIKYDTFDRTYKQRTVNDNLTGRGKHPFNHYRTFYKNFNSWNPFWRRTFGEYNVIKKSGEVSNKESQIIPSRINLPNYAISGIPSPSPTNIEIKNESQIEGMKRSCQLARKILNTVGERLTINLTTNEIDKIVYQLTIENNAYPSPLNYKGFPKSVCTSVNNVACHGIPDDRPLQNGDIISVDITVYYEGYHGDCCETFLIGEVDDAGRKLVDIARRSRDEAIAECGPGIPFSVIGEITQDVAVREKLNIIPVFIGHGIGSYFHGPPDIYHFYNDLPGIMKPGMTFTIEPIVCQGSEEIVILEDGWTAVTIDNGRAAQFEHTVLITPEGHEILTDYF